LLENIWGIPIFNDTDKGHQLSPVINF